MKTRDKSPEEFARRRNKILNELESIQRDADLWNRTHPNEEPIIIDLDLTAEVEEAMKKIKAEGGE